MPKRVFFKTKIVIMEKCSHENPLPKNWRLIRQEVLESDNFTCQMCNKHLPDGPITVHHIIPRSDGGNSDNENLISLCPDCHDEIEETSPSREGIKSYRLRVYNSTALKKEWHDYLFSRAEIRESLINGNKRIDSFNNYLLSINPESISIPLFNLEDESHYSKARISV